MFASVPFGTANQNKLFVLSGALSYSILSHQQQGRNNSCTKLRRQQNCYKNLLYWEEEQEESAAQPSLLTPMPSLPFKSRRPGQPRIPWAPANRNLSLVEQTLVKGAYAKKRPMKDSQGHTVSVDIAICWGSMATWPGRKRHLGVNVERQLLLQHCWLELLDNPVQQATCLNSISPLQTDWFALIGLIWRHN